MPLAVVSRERSGVRACGCRCSFVRLCLVCGRVLALAFGSWNAPVAVAVAVAGCGSSYEPYGGASMLII